MTHREGTLVRAVVRALADLATDAPADTLSMSAFLVLRFDGSAVAIDRRLTPDFRRIEPRVRRSGLRVVELPTLTVQPRRGTTVLADPGAALGLSIEALDQRWPPVGTDDDLSSGEIPLARLVYAGNPAPESPAAAIGDIVPLVRDSTGRATTADVALLAAFATRVPLDGLRQGEAHALLALISA